MKPFKIGVHILQVSSWVLHRRMIGHGILHQPVWRFETHACIAKNFHRANIEKPIIGRSIDLYSLVFLFKRECFWEKNTRPRLFTLLKRTAGAITKSCSTHSYIRKGVGFACKVSEICVLMSRLWYLSSFLISQFNVKNSSNCWSPSKLLISLDRESWVAISFLSHL